MVENTSEYRQFSLGDMLIDNFLHAVSTCILLNAFILLRRANQVRIFFTLDWHNP